MSSSSTVALLSASGVRLGFSALVVLNGIDLAIAPGEAVGIVGPNGAGKTSLLNVLAGAYRPAEGHVSFRGHDISKTSAASRCRAGIGRSHQIPRPFSGMTVFENLMVAATHGGALTGNKAVEQCVDSLHLSSMGHLANRRAETLGLLDRKRLELARALATGPAVLLLDEIGGGLTDGEAAELVVTVRQIKERGIAIIWIEHIVHVLLQVVDRLICMDAGRIIASGEPREVLANVQVVEAYLGGVPA